MKLPIKLHLAILIFAAIGAVLAGCNRDDGPASSSTTRPTVAGGVQSGAVAAAAVEPAATQPDASFLIIDRREEWFPPAMLRLREQSGQVIARVYSDDPTDVLTGKQTVNSYDFAMSLPRISDCTQIASAVWTTHAKSSDRVDTPYGIFLRDRQEVLQPMDATVRFPRQRAAGVGDDPGHILDVPHER